MAKKPNFGEILSNLLIYLDDPSDPSIREGARALFDRGTIQEFAKPKGNLALLEDPTDEFIRDLRQVVKRAQVGDIDNVSDAVFDAFRNAKTSIASGVPGVFLDDVKLGPDIADLLADADNAVVVEGLDASRPGPLSPRNAPKDFDFDLSKTDPSAPMYSESVFPEGEGPGGRRFRGESPEKYRRRLQQMGRKIAPGQALTPEQAIALARRTPEAERVFPSTRPSRPVRGRPASLPDTPKGTFGRNLKARLLKMRRGIPGIPKLGLIGGSLAGLGATMTLMEILDERAQITGRSARAMKEGLMEGSDASIAALVAPSLESELTGSRALREIAQAGERNMGVSQELRDIIGADQRQLQAMKQKINPSLREAYARVGLL